MYIQENIFKKKYATMSIKYLCNSHNKTKQNKQKAKRMQMLNENLNFRMMDEALQ